MPFWKKEEKKKAEAEVSEIKKAITAVPERPKVELAPLPERPKFAPLFMKIDRYQEVLKDIKNLRAILMSLHEVLTLRKELERLKTESNSFLERNIQQINSVITKLDSEFIRPKLMESEVFKEEPPAAELEGYVSDLQSELSRLESKLHKMK